MQTSTIAANEASEHTLGTRFAIARDYFIQRRVRHYASVLAAFGVDLTDKRKTHLNLLWNGRAAVTAKDAPLVNAIETVVEQLKNAPDIAA